MIHVKHPIPVYQARAGGRGKQGKRHAAGAAPGRRLRQAAGEGEGCALGRLGARFELMPLGVGYVARREVYMGFAHTQHPKGALMQTVVCVRSQEPERV